MASGVRGQLTSVVGLRKAFEEKVVLDGLDLAVQPGEFVALLGRSGSGKTTLLRIVAELDRDFEGSVTTPRHRSVVFQDARLLPWARVFDNVVLGLADRHRGRAALAEVGLLPHARAWPSTLSGGEAQRAALARALVREPELLLLDEPFGSLDALTRMQMHSLLRQLVDRRRPATLLVTHDVDEAILLADRIMVLADGRIRWDQPVDLERPRRRKAVAMAALRTRLLAELGVEDA